MENRINVAELLKDCPKGMELDCVSYDNVSFDKISDDKKSIYPIFCYITDKEGNRSSISFTKNGCESKRYGAKCVIFPKGKTTWEGFQKPFKDGDVIYTYNFIAILSHIAESGAVWYHCYYCISTKNFNAKHYCGIGNINNDEFRFATEEEKAKLFKVIKDNGYKWNPKTKTLEKLPKFKVGNRIKKVKDSISGIITNISDDGSYKVEYQGGGISFVSLAYQDEWELVSNKFDITTLKPFDKVLVRDYDNGMWCASIFSHTWRDKYFCICIWHNQCIPYEGNEHLLGTTNDCDEYFKNW